MPDSQLPIQKTKPVDPLLKAAIPTAKIVLNAELHTVSYTVDWQKVGSNNVTRLVEAVRGVFEKEGLHPSPLVIKHEPKSKEFSFSIDFDFTDSPSHIQAAVQRLTAMSQPPEHTRWG